MDNLTVVVPFRNGHATLGRLLDSLPRNVPVIVADDVSDRPYTARGQERVIRLPARGYFSGAVNTGIEACKTDVLVLNQDAWLDGETWQAQVRGWQSEHYAIAGDGVMRHPAWPRGYVQGTCMFLSRAAVEQVGLLNERDYPLWGATAEWQLRACRAGLKALPCQVGGFHHARQGSFGTAIAQTLVAEPDKKAWLVRTPPAISVIVACYNYGRYLGDAISSLLGGASCLGDCPPQTFQSFEVVIVDDMSTDNSWELIQPLADDWRGVHVLRNPKNLGTAATLNAGIRAAHGKYITFLSTDDMMEPTRLEQLYRLAEANPHRVIYDDLYLFKAGQRFERMVLPEYDFEKTLYKNQMHAGILYEKAAWQECNGYPEIMRDGREDWAFNVALGARGYCGVHLREPLYLYRREQQNRSVHNVSVQWYETYRARLRALYPELYAGERPSMCCGSGKNKTLRKTAAGGTHLSVEAPIGAEGMTLLEYTGIKAPSTFFATNPHQTYVYGGKYHFIYVDNRHVAQMLDALEGRRPMFRRGALPAPHLATAVAAPTVVEVAAELEPAATAADTIIKDISAPVVAQASACACAPGSGASCACNPPPAQPEKPVTTPKRYSPKKKVAALDD